MTPPTLESVANDLADWRRTRTKRGPIPNELRTKISMLSPRYRVSEITTVLSLNSAQLKAFANSRPPRKTDTPAAVEFIRVNAPQTISGKVECHLKRPDGAILECVFDVTHFNRLMEAFLCWR